MNRKEDAKNQYIALHFMYGSEEGLAEDKGEGVRRAVVELVQSLGTPIMHPPPNLAGRFPPP